MTEHNVDQAIEDFLIDHSCLKAMPENSLRILKLLQDANFRMKQLVKLIEQDAAIAARVIQTVNSAAYAKSNRITQLDKATVYLGIKTVKEIVVAATVHELCKPAPIGRFHTQDLWDHSVGVAVLCRELATHSKLIDPELAFLAGILHDLGLLLSVQSEVATAVEVFEDAEDRSTPFTLVERSYFGFDHCEMGYRLGTEWNFPGEVTAAIRWHHSPDDSPAQYRQICRHVYIADTFCSEAKVGFPLTTALQRVSDQLLSEASLTRENTDEILTHLRVLLRLHQG